MAFDSKVGSLSSSNSLFFQATRSMSSAKLLVGGLAYGTDEMGLREAFQEYGEVTDAEVFTDRDSGRSLGFGFVSYTSADAANTALQDMDGKELHGRRIRVNFAQERPCPFFGGGGYGGAGGCSGGGGGGYGGCGGYGGAGGYGGGGGGYGGVGGYSGGNRNAFGGDDNLFGGGVGGASGAPPSGCNEEDVDGSLDHDLAGNDGWDDIKDDDYAKTSDKCVCM